MVKSASSPTHWRLLALHAVAAELPPSTIAELGLLPLALALSGGISPSCSVPPLSSAPRASTDAGLVEEESWVLFMFLALMAARPEVDVDVRSVAGSASHVVAAVAKVLAQHADALLDIAVSDWRALALSAASGTPNASSPAASEMSALGRLEGEFILFTVTFHVNPANDLTYPPSYVII